MPLFLDDEQVKPKDFAYLHGMSEIEYNRLLKKPIFKLDSSQVKKKSTIITNKNLSEPPIQGIKCTFWFKDLDGMTKKLVYAESRAPKIEGGVRSWVYKPGYLFLKGQIANFLKKEDDKTVYMYFRPDNPASPFAGAEKVFSFVDSVAQTLKDAANMSDIQKALTHATTAEEEELIILAKGLKILTSDDYDMTELRVKMQQFAIGPVTNPIYVKAMNDEVVRIEGRIRNLVDKGMVRLKQEGHGRQWVGDKGWKEGAYIGELIVNQNDDAVQRLITFIKSDPDSYLYDLRNSTVLIHADRKIREALAKEKVVVPAHLAEINMTGSGQKSLKDEVYDTESAKEFVFKKGFKRIATNVKQFREAVAEGKVTYENCDIFLASLFTEK